MGGKAPTSAKVLRLYPSVNLPSIEEKTSTVRRHIRSMEKGEGETITRGDHSERGKGNTRRGDYTERGLYGEGGEDIQREETGDIHEVPGTNKRGDYKERGLQLA